MDQQGSFSTFSSQYGDGTSVSQSQIKEKSRIARGDCTVSASTSHTQYFKRDIYDRDRFKRITTNEFCGLTAEPISGSSDTFHCEHKFGRKYTKKGLLKKNTLKNLDPIPGDPKLREDCPPIMGWGVVSKIMFLVSDPMGVQQLDRLQEYLRDLTKTSSNGYTIDVLDNLQIVFDYLIDSLDKKQLYHRETFAELLKNLEKPISLSAVSDVEKHFDTIRDFIGYLGYLLLPLEDDDLFELVSKGILYQLSAPDKQRGKGAVRMRHALAAARKTLHDTVVRMIAVCTPPRFPTFMKIAFILACDCEENCVDLMMENIIENIFYRFNPYFPERSLPTYDINPSNLDDLYVQLGESSTNMQLVLSVLLVLVRTMRPFLDKNPRYSDILPCPDEYSQRCFVWAYRYECRAREHKHQRSTLTVIAHMLIHMFDQRLTVFCNVLMPDVLTLSVMTEMPPRDDWTNTVHFNTSQADVQFKIILIYFSVDLLKKYSINQFMAESRFFIIGLMYLVDPGLSSLKAKWTMVLFNELRKTALQALIFSYKLIPAETHIQISLIRRIMWYIEWYSMSTYELPVLYWSVRLLQTSLQERDSPYRAPAVREFLHTHSVIIILNLCDTLLDQKLPPLEKSQSIIGLNLRLLTSCLEQKAKFACYVYPSLKWPASINRLVRKMLNIVIYSLQEGTICSDRWLLSIMNLIWEAIIWRKENRDSFIANNGIYQLLDIITMTRYPVQCMTLALICDVMREGAAVGQLITWRANMHAASAHPNLVKPGSTIATLLAALFRRDCRFNEIAMDASNIIQDLEFPLMSLECKKYLFSPEFTEIRNQRTPFCLSAFSIAGSRMAKCFAILQMLSEDLKEKVDLADEAYNLYKNIELKEEDESILVLISHFMTIKLNEVWSETQVQNHGYVPIDTEILNEFLLIGRGWAKSIQQQQMDVIEKFKKMQEIKENNLYTFLERVRLNTALDALREVRCTARSTDRARITHALIFDAVRAYHRRSLIANKLNAPVVQTYGPSLDDYNIIGQNIKVVNIIPKHKPKKRETVLLEPRSTLEILRENSQEKRDSQNIRGSKSSRDSKCSYESLGSHGSKCSCDYVGLEGSAQSKGSRDSKGSREGMSGTKMGPKNRRKS